MLKEIKSRKKKAIIIKPDKFKQIELIYRNTFIE